MYLIWFILLAVVLGFSISTFTGYKYNETQIVWQVGTIAWLYIFYLFDKMEIGLYLLLGLMAVMFLAALVLNVRRKSLKNQIKGMMGDYSFVGYVLFLVFAFATVWNKVPFWGDELRYWAAVPKILVRYHGTLQLNNGFQIFSVDYIPGISIWQYFLEYINGNWSEGLLFFAYAAIIGAILLPLGHNVKTYKGAFILASILYIVPLFFFHTKANDYAVFYQSLYVDPMVGVAAGIVVWLCLGKPWQDRKRFATYVLTCTFLALLKSSGIAFVLIADVTILAYIFIKERGNLRKLWLWIGFLIPLGLWEAWNLLIKVYNIKKELEYSVGSFLNGVFIKEFIKAILTKKVLTTWLVGISEFFSFIVCFVILCIFLVALIRIANKSAYENHGYTKLIYGMLIIQAIVYVIGLYGLCVTTFEGHLNSYARYISTVLEMMFCFIACETISRRVAIRETIRSSKGDKVVMTTIIGVGVLLILIAPIRHVNNTADTYPDYIIEDSLAVSSIFGNIQDEIPEAEWSGVALLYDEPTWESESWLSWSKQWYGHLLNNISYESIGYGIQVRQSSYYTSEINTIELENGGVLFELTSDRKWQDVEYIVALHGNYVETPIHDWELYKVNKIDDKKIFLDYVASDSKPEEFVNYH